MVIHYVELKDIIKLKYIIQILNKLLT